MGKGGRIKYFLAVLTCANLVFAATGCGGGSGVQDENAGAVQTADAETAKTAEEGNAAEEPDAAAEQETEPEQAALQDPQEWTWDAADEQTLRYAFAKGFGGRAGVCVPMAALSDAARMDIVKGQFNSVTMENEMKPDTFLGDKPNIGEDGFPVLSFTVPDMMLKEIKAYNDTAGKDGRKIMVRGHVLVWHSQTPEWFFHEEYNVEIGRAHV